MTDRGQFTDDNFDFLQKSAVATDFYRTSPTSISVTSPPLKILSSSFYDILLVRHTLIRAIGNLLPHPATLNQEMIRRDRIQRQPRCSNLTICDRNCQWWPKNAESLCDEIAQIDWYDEVLAFIDRL